MNMPADFCLFIMPIDKDRERGGKKSLIIIILSLLKEPVTACHYPQSHDTHFQQKDHEITERSLQLFRGR